MEFRLDSDTWVLGLDTAELTWDTCPGSWSHVSQSEEARGPSISLNVSSLAFSSGHSFLISQQSDVSIRAWPGRYWYIALERIHKCYTTDWHWTWESCYGANPLHRGFIPLTTGRHWILHLPASRGFTSVLTWHWGLLEAAPIWIIVKSHRHRCCDGDSARGSSQLSMAPCYRSQLIDGAHVSRLRLSTAGRGHSAQMWSVDHTQHSFQLGEPLRAYTHMRYWSVCLCQHFTVYARTINKETGTKISKGQRYKSRILRRERTENTLNSEARRRRKNSQSRSPARDSAARVGTLSVPHSVSPFILNPWISQHFLSNVSWPQPHKNV